MSLLAWLLAAVLLFWVIGAYNRLIVMRNELAQAWARLQSALDQRGAALQPLVACLRAPMSAEAGALDVWIAAHAQASEAAAAMTRRPVNASHATAWVGAEAGLASAASRALALLDQHSELALQEPVPRWPPAGARAKSSCRLRARPSMTWRRPTTKLSGSSPRVGWRRASHWNAPG